MAAATTAAMDSVMRQQRKCWMPWLNYKHKRQRRPRPHRIRMARSKSTTNNNSRTHLPHNYRRIKFNNSSWHRRCYSTHRHCPRCWRHSCSIHSVRLRPRRLCRHFSQSKRPSYHRTHPVPWRRQRRVSTCRVSMHSYRVRTRNSSRVCNFRSNNASKLSSSRRRYRCRHLWRSHRNSYSISSRVLTHRRRRFSRCHSNSSRFSQPNSHLQNQYHHLRQPPTSIPFKLPKIFQKWFQSKVHRRRHHQKPNHRRPSS